MDAQIQRAIQAWLNDPAIADADKREISDLHSRGDQKELTDRFYRDLEFGTGGLRGIMGAGRNRMNVYTVGAAAQGLANYIGRQGEPAKKAGIAIAFDSRHLSPEFARRVACVMAGNGITAHIFKELRPTPALSFAVRWLGCTSGVVVTASHNPPAYNGFKAYWSDGGQVTPPHDEAIMKEVHKVTDYGQIKTTQYAEALSQGLIREIGLDLDQAFLTCVNTSCLNPEVCRKVGKKLKIVYTPLHGTGITLVPAALRMRGFESIHIVPEQAITDGSFPTTPSPNPEEGAAMKMGIDLAMKEGADLVIATDPDADRMGIAVRRPDGQFVLMNGNQIAALLTHYICDQYTRQGRMPQNGVVISTIVSSDFMKEIARSFGAGVIETLTGFKWIAEQIRHFELAGPPGRPSRQFLFGAEESYGYMPCTYTRDKDAVTSAAFIAELAAAQTVQGESLYALLESLYQRHGYFQEGAKSFTLPGADGAARIAGIMRDLRAKPPRELAGRPVKAIGDLLSRELRTTDGSLISKYDLPESDVLIIILDDGTKVIGRPSGTEPKIKFYILVRGPGQDLEQARAQAGKLIDEIGKELTRLIGT